MFDWLMSPERRLQKHQRRLTNRDSQPEDREASARWLAQQDSPKALLALVSRFDMNLPHQLNDKAEKEFVYGLIAAKGDAALKPLRVHLRKCRQFALPMRLYEELAGAEAAVQMVYELLQIEYDRDDFKPEKKKDMLVWLTERRDERAIDEVAKFVHDFDEGVRYAAAEVVIAQDDDRGRPLLEKVIVHPEEDSNRLRVRLCEVFGQRRWTVDDPESIAQHLPEGFVVQDGRIAMGASRRTG